MQECLTNVLRHSQANQVEIRIFANDHDKSVEVTVTDDGVGFEVGRVEGFGLNGMRERVLGLNGVFLLESSITSGTKVTAIFPLEEGRN